MEPRSGSLRRKGLRKAGTTLQGMYPFKVISPRTCGNCGGIEGTAWYEICVKYKRFDELTDKQKQTVMRIYNEPDSIMNTEEGGNENAD